MHVSPLVPPIKCQGIKTRLVPALVPLAVQQPFARWVEPFLGSGVAALNVAPMRAVLADTNAHLITFYTEVQGGRITGTVVREHLGAEGDRLRTRGAAHYYDVRQRFNDSPTPLDFLFLNRSCFNGLVRFNRRGQFNVPFCRKADRFSKAYVTRIANQVDALARVVRERDWLFVCADFREVLAGAEASDLVYADPPYAGRHADYFNAWSEADEAELTRCLGSLPCRFILSTWHSNRYRRNPLLERHWSAPPFHTVTQDHFYHVGAAEAHRHAMKEALVLNFEPCRPGDGPPPVSRARAPLSAGVSPAARA